MTPGASDSRRPHLALITCNPVETGGMQTFSRRLVATVLHAGWRVTVGLSGMDIYSSEAGAEGSSLAVDHVNWLDGQLAGDRVYRRSLAADRYRWFKRTRPDVALFIQSSNTPYRASVLGAYLAGVPTVTTHRTLAWPLDDAGSRRHCFGLLPGLGLYRRRARLRTQLTARLARFVVYNSHTVRAGYEDVYCYPNHKGVVIANALNPTLLSALSLKPQKPCAHEPRVVGYVGRLGGEKRVDVLIRAMAMLIPSQRVVAHIWGDGPDRQQLEQLAADLGIADRFQFKGQTRDVRSALASMDLFVMPSARESSSNAVLEAQAAGLPVIVTDAGGLPELVDHGQCGVVVPAGVAGALAAAIGQLLDSPERMNELGQAGRRRAFAKHDPALTGQQWLDVLESAMKRSPRAQSPLPPESSSPPDRGPWPQAVAEGRA
jgi:glycosyltransferase involved in cell wall biosynthesis